MNYQITAPLVRLIGEDGKQIGIVSRDEALNKARELEVDLVEIASKANPPVVKIIDFRKFLYQEAKKEKLIKKKIKEAELKEIRLTPFIGKNDFNVRAKKAREFLNERNQVRVVVKFTGREIRHPEFGREILERFLKDLADVSQIEKEPQFQGKQLVAFLKPNYVKKQSP